MFAKINGSYDLGNCLWYWIRYPVLLWRVFNCSLKEQHREFVLVYENVCNSLPFQTEINLKYGMLVKSWLKLSILTSSLVTTERIIGFYGANVFFQNWTVGFGVLCVSRKSKWYCQLSSPALLQFFIYS